MNKDIKDHASKGGTNRAKNLTPQQRSESASIAAKARWTAYREKKNHICDYGCRCICGVFLQRHSTHSECQNQECTNLV